MNTYKYLGGWEEKGTFFTENKIYLTLTNMKKGVIELEDDSFADYGMGCEVDSESLNKYFEEVAL